jgi:UDP-N-acetylglucosamine/UDP-N-acetylgalactosamine diphosphorylase
VEYSEMDRATAELRAPDGGGLAFNAGNICIHFYSTRFLAGACAPAALPKVYHVAKKAIPFADPVTGETVRDKARLAAAAAAAHGGKHGGYTGLKLESFIFDVFPAATAMAVLEVPRDAEFSPVKNAPARKRVE